jgi:hypothetical protein
MTPVTRLTSFSKRSTICFGVESFYNDVLVADGRRVMEYVLPDEI